MKKLGKDVWILVGLLAFLVIAVLIAGSKQGYDESVEIMPRRTTYSARPGGTKALYVTLGKLGYPVQRRLKRIDSGMADGTLFILSPERPISKAEWRGLRAWVTRGNTLILAGNQPPELSSLGHRPKTARTTAVAPSFLASGVRSFVVAGDNRVERTTMSFGCGSLGTSYG